MQNIYLDNAASAPILDEVVDAMMEALTLLNGNPSSTHKHGRKARAAIEKSRKEVAQYFNASIGEIFFTSGGTEANNTILHCAVEQLGVNRIITSPTEHPSVKNAIQFIRKLHPISVIELKVDRTGQINMVELESLLNEPGQKTLVSIMHANNETGLLHSIDEIGKLCVKYGALFHTDAVQTVGHLAIDLSQSPVSFLSASGHKFHGPKGTGILYVNNDNIIEPFIRGGSQERNVRAGTENVAGIVGMARALSFCKEKLEEKAEHVKSLRHYFINKIEKELPEIQFISQKSPEDCLFTILNLHVPSSQRSDMLLMNLDIEGISASGGSACSSGAEKASYVIESIGWGEEGKSIRFSLSFMNTEEEIDTVIEALKKYH